MTAFTNQTYNMLADSLLFSVRGGWQEPEKWSGTNRPKITERIKWRKDAEHAMKKGNKEDLDDPLFNHIWNSSNTVFEIEHVIVGAGYAAVMDAATLPFGQSSNSSTGLPAIMMIGKAEPWSTYKVKLMGQSPTNLSPTAFQVLPIHLLYGAEYPDKPQNCLDYKSRKNCYLSSEVFALAIALSRNRVGVPVLNGIVQAVNTVGDDYYVATVTISKRNQQKTVSIKTKNLDIASGPGPPRKLPDTQFHDTVRQNLRSPANGFKRHLFGGEALQEQEKLPPAEGNKKILIYGGAPTSAWVYERIFEVATIFKGDGNTKPYDVIWVAPLRWQNNGEENLTPKEKKNIAFGAIDIGLRNKRVLQHSEGCRFVAKIINVEQNGAQAKVTFDKPIGSHGNQIICDQVIESIGLDPNRTGGVNDILNGFQDRFRIIQDSHGDRPLGLELDEGARTIRILGAAALAASTKMLPGTKTHHIPGVVALSDYMSSNMLLTDDYANKIRAFLESLPEEARVPPGITVSGITISRANNPSFALSGDHNININTASLEELKTRTIDVPNNTVPLFSTQEAEAIVECRKNMKFGIPLFPGQPSSSSKHWIPGFTSIFKSDLERCEELDFEDDNYDRIKSHIRV